MARVNKKLLGETPVLWKIGWESCECAAMSGTFLAVPDMLFAHGITRSRASKAWPEVPRFVLGDVPEVSAESANVLQISSD